MAIKEEFEILISRNGEMKIVSKGFSGRTCAGPLKNMQTIFKAKDSRIEFTEEYYRETGTVESRVKKD